MERYRGYLDIPLSDLKFTDDEPLGIGTSSKVLKAIWKPKRFAVAVKMLTSFIEREARVLDSIRHENIVRFYAAVFGSPNCCLVMELCAGGTLCDYVTDESKPLDIDLAKQWTTGIARGMYYLHYEAPDKPILHRNLTSRNIVLDKKGERLVPKICGFGYAKPNCPDGLTRTKHNPTVWKGPEVLSEKKPVMKSDVYSFCMVLWHLLSRKLPFQGEEKKLSLIPDIALKGKRPPIVSDWPDSLKSLMEKGWKADPEDRPDFTEVLSVLEGRSAVQSVHQLKHKSQKQDSWDIPHSDIDFCSHDQNDSLGTNNVYSCVVKAVYKQKDVAAKILNLHAGITNKTLTDYLDAVHCSKIGHHKNIVQIMGAYIAESSWRIVMELIPTSLRNYLQENGALENTPLKIVAEGMASGLQYLHSDEQALGFAHGGLSSNNVLLDVNSPDEREWSVKLSDYYLTTLCPDGSVSHAKGYAAPELVASRMRPKTQADIYSFGVILVEMNTDPVLPISNWDETLDEVEHNWKALSDLVKKCICNADVRLPSVGYVCKELENLK